MITVDDRGDRADHLVGDPAPIHLRYRRFVGLWVILAVLAVSMLASLAFGTNPIRLTRAWQVLWNRDDSEASIIVWTLRLPRTLIGMLVGAAFGIAGALIQALTRNPLADSGVLGVNAGAGFAVTVGVGMFGTTTAGQYVWFALVGALLASVLVYMIGSAGIAGRATPVQLVLAGVALGAVLGGITSLLTLIDQETFRAMRRWGLGSIARTSADDTLLVLPFLLVGFAIAFALSGALNAVALGDDLAVALGTNVVRTRVLGVIGVTLLAGGGTALTGGIAFVGLMVPHIVRWFVGPDQRWIMAYSALAAPALLLTADVIGRVVLRPNEVEVGIVTAVVGAPVLIALVRRRTVSGL